MTARQQLLDQLAALEAAEAADGNDWRTEAVRALDREATQRARRASIKALRAILDEPPPDTTPPLTPDEVESVRLATAPGHSPAPYTEGEAHLARSLLANLDACNEAYVNASAERDMYDVAYKDMRAVVKRVIEDPSLPPNLLTRLEAVFMDGEVTP